MSEQEKETELVVGVIDSVVKKRADTWQVVVKPDGSQHTKNLWTKSASTVEAVERILGEHRAFACNVSYWTNQEGKQVRSLWLENITENGAEAAGSVPSPSAPAQGRTSTPSNEGMSKEEWARKDSAIHKMACLKTAAAALTHTIPSQPSLDDLNKFNAHVLHLALGWHRTVLAERDDPTGEDLPF